MSIDPSTIQRLKQYDTRPVLEVALKNPDGSAHDLSAVDDVFLHIALEGRDTRVTRTMSIEGDPTLGVVSYTWDDSDWDELIVGLHRMEYEAVTGTDRQTFPNGGEDDGEEEDAYHWLRVWSDLAQG